MPQKAVMDSETYSQRAATYSEIYNKYKYKISQRVTQFQKERDLGLSFCFENHPYCSFQFAESESFDQELVMEEDAFVRLKASIIEDSTIRYYRGCQKSRQTV